MKKIGKILSLVLILVMLCGMVAGCSSKDEKLEDKTADSAQVTKAEENKDATATPAAENTVAPDDTTPEPEKKEVQTVDLTIAMNSQPQVEPVAWNETEVWKKFFDYVEENYGYRINAEWVFYDVDKFNLMLVSGELEDVVLCNGQEVANTIIANGYAYDFNQTKDKLPNAMSETYVQRNQVVSELTGGADKALYFFPQMVGAEYSKGGTSQPRGYSVRWDWYKEIGCPAINSDEDYINVLEQMCANHPTNEAGEKTYAFGLRSDKFIYWYQRAAMCKPSFVNFWTYDGYLYTDGYDDNVLYNGYTDVSRSCYWQDMKFMYELNKRGLFDQDSFTQSKDEFVAKSANGRYAGSYRTTTDLYNTQVANDPNTLAGYVTVPSENALVFSNNLHLAGYFPDEYTCVSAESENLDAALAFVDALHNLDIQRMFASGIQGVHWDYDANGVPKMNQATIDMINAHGDDYKKSGISMVGLTYVQGSTLCDDGYPVNIRDTEESRKETLTVFDKDYSAYYGVDYPSQACTKLVEEGKTLDYRNNYSQTAAIAREEMPSDIARILTKCNDICYNAMPELICAKDDAEFAEIQARVISEIEGVDEATAWEWCKKTHEAAREVIRPIYEEYLKNYEESIN